MDVLFQYALTQEQRNWVPSFTTHGFEKADIPSDVYSLLLDEYHRAKENMVEEGCVQGVINCQEIQSTIEESFLKHKRRTFMIELR